MNHSDYDEIWVSALIVVGNFSVQKPHVVFLFGCNKKWPAVLLMNRFFMEELFITIIYMND